jgi:hypothetical protein
MSLSYMQEGLRENGNLAAPDRVLAIEKTVTNNETLLASLAEICQLKLTPASLEAASVGETAITFAVTTGGIATDWMPLADSPWIKVTDPIDPVSGGGTVTFDVVPNEMPGSAARTGAINIDTFGLAFMVMQDAAGSTRPSQFTKKEGKKNDAKGKEVPKHETTVVKHETTVVESHHAVRK